MLNDKRLWFGFTLGILQIGFGIAIWGGSAKRVSAAEDIILNYGALEFSVSVSSLETYATEGKLEGALKSYADLLTPQQLQQFKAGMTTSAEFSHLAIAQFLYSYQGEKMLERVSGVIETTARQPGFYAIRSALILAAADEKNGGLTPLNILKKFPTKSLRIDSSQGFKLFKDLSRVAQANNQAIVEVKKSAQQQRRNKITVAPKVRDLDLLMPGDYSYQKRNFIMNDRDRGRTFPLDLYLPKAKSSEPFPLVIISHGLGSDLTTFAYLAKHLASHGFAVAVPEHPGSSALQIDALLTGLDSDVTPPEELIDRPLDIQFLLDKLEDNYKKQIDTNNAGIIGQSFGAYTALAVAGAQLNWSTLKRDCDNIKNSWNISLLLQCLAMQLPTYDRDLDLKDDRIKSAIAINPLTSSIFGREGLARINIPVMIVSGSADPITPALSEQIIPFTWLTYTKKYLVLLTEGTHFSTLNESAGSIPVPPQAIGPNPKIAQTYIKQLGLAFFGTYTQKQPQYASYLNAEYGYVISKRKMPLSLIETLDAESLKLK